MRIFLPIALLLVNCGCLQPHLLPDPGPLSYTIDGKSCNSQTMLTGCDSASPPHCAHSVTRYKSGCERLVVKR